MQTSSASSLPSSPEGYCPLHAVSISHSHLCRASLAEELTRHAHSSAPARPAFAPVAQLLRRDAGYDRIRRHITGHYCSGADPGVLPDRDARQDHCAAANDRAATDAHWRDPERRADDRHAHRFARMERTDDAHAGRQAGLLADPEVTRVDEAMRPDPRAATDHTAPADASGKQSVVADVDAV